MSKLPKDSKDPVILVTRPLHAAHRFVRAAAHLPLSFHIDPLCTVQTMDFQVPDMGQYDVLIFTSAYGVRFFTDKTGGALDTNMPVCCVGDYTAQAAQNVGYINVHSADGNAQDLIDLLSGQTKILRRALYPCARITRTDMIVPALDIYILPVYETIPADSLTAETQAQFKGGDISGVLFFSGLTAQTFHDLAGSHIDMSSVTAYCISETVADIARNTRYKDVRVCEAPNQASFIKMLENH